MLLITYPGSKLFALGVEERLLEMHGRLLDGSLLVYVEVLVFGLVRLERYVPVTLNNKMFGVSLWSGILILT